MGVVKDLLEDGADNKRDRGKTALHYAAQKVILNS